MAPEARPGRVGRGIQVKTIRRDNSGSNGGSFESGSGSAMSLSSRQRNKVKKKPSMRYREKVLGAVRPGENFFPDAKMAEEFEQRVLEIYAPTPDLNESVRDLPLQLQAQRDGSEFKLPRLGQICLEIVCDHFASRVLPHLQRDEQQSRSNTSSHVQFTPKKKRRKVGIFGLQVQDEEEDKDFIPDKIDVPQFQSRERKSRIQNLSRNDKDLLEDIHESNSYILTILPISVKEALQRLLEKKSPQHLNFYVLAKYFLTRSTVRACKSIRALSTVGGLGDRGISSLLRTLNVSIFDDARTSNKRPASDLERLHLQAFTRLTTQQLLPLLESASNLQEICLRGCISVDAGAMKRLVKSSGKTLRIVNLNWTGVRVEGVEEIIRGCPNLEVLKVAHVQNLNDATVTTMMDRVTRATIEDGFIPLGKLKKLKVADTQIGIVGLGSLLKHCGNKLESLDISFTRVGGEGALQILFVLLGFTNDFNHSSDNPVSVNNTLRKINLSGLSLPQDDLCSLSLESLKALQVFDFREVRTRPQDSGSHDLALGIKSSLLTYLMIGLGARSSEQGVAKHPPKYLYDRISISNKVIMDKDDRLDSPIHLLNHTSIKHLNFSGANLTSVDWYQSPESANRGCESLDLSNCLLPENPAWELLGAAGRLRRINLSGTKVSELDVERLVELNPYLTSINLTGCRGIPVTRRRKYFETIK